MNEELVKCLETAVEGKKIVCFGVGIMFAQFNSVWKKQIDMLIDNDARKHGKQVSTYGGRKHKICDISEISMFSPEETIVLITSVDVNAITSQLNSLGFFNIIEWDKLRDYCKGIFSNVAKLSIHSELKAMSSHKKKIRVAHVSSHYGHNAGDATLNYCIKQLFEQYFVDIQFDSIWLNDKVNNDLIGYINRHDVLLIGGGGLFMQNSHKNHVSGWQWAISEEQIDQIYIPIMVYSVGYNYFFNQEPTILFMNNVKKLLEKSSFFALRNTGSIEKIKDIAADSRLSSKVIYQPCVTTCISKYIELQDKNSSTTVAVNVAMDYVDDRYAGDKEYIVTEIAKAIGAISKNGYKIIVSVHCYGDWEFVNYLRGSGCDDFEVKDLQTEVPIEIINFYSSVGVVISSRGHGQMIPFGVSTPVISLCSQPKNRWFCEDVRMNDYLINLFDNNNIKYDILRVFEKINTTDDYYKINEEQKERLWNITKDNIDIIKRFLNVSI